MPQRPAAQPTASLPSDPPDSPGGLSARGQALAHRFNASELDVEGRGIIMADAAVMYRAEAFHGNELDIHVAVADLNRSGCDFLYQLIRVSDGREIARVKTGIVFFDYAARKVARVPEGFAHRFASAGIQTDENLSAQ